MNRELYYIYIYLLKYHYTLHTLHTKANKIQIGLRDNEAPTLIRYYYLPGVTHDDKSILS